MINNKMKHLILFVLIFAGCSMPEYDEQRDARKERELLSQEYIYIDNGGVLHFQTNCMYLLNLAFDEKEKHSVGLQRVLKTDVTDSMLLNCCPGCVNDSRYKTLIRKGEVR